MAGYGIKPDWLKPYHFKPGQSGNPKGKPKLDDEARELKRLDRDSYNRMLNKIGNLKTPELQAIINDPNTVVWEKMIATVAAKAIARGDPSRMEALLSRAIGPVKTQVEMTGANGEPLAAIQINQLTEKAAALLLNSRKDALPEGS